MWPTHRVTRILSDVCTAPVLKEVQISIRTGRNPLLPDLLALPAPGQPLAIVPAASLGSQPVAVSASTPLQAPVEVAVVATAEAAGAASSVGSAASEQTTGSARAVKRSLPSDAPSQSPDKRPANGTTGTLVRSD